MAAYLNPVDQGQQVVLEKAVVLIGRHPDCDVVLTCSRKVSRRHCCVVQVNGKLLVRDLGSMNGVQINGKRIRVESPLRLGDELSVGDVRYVLEAGKPKRSNSAEESEPRGNSESASPVSHRPVDISQKFPVPLPESEIPVLSEEEMIDEESERAADVQEAEELDEYDELELIEDDELEMLELVEEPESKIIILEDSDEIDGMGSAIEIIPE